VEKLYNRGAGGFLGLLPAGDKGLWGIQVKGGGGEKSKKDWNPLGENLGGD